jgi:hypothetical protein
MSFMPSTAKIIAHGFTATGTGAFRASKQLRPIWTARKRERSQRETCGESAALLCDTAIFVNDAR